MKKLLLFSIFSFLLASAFGQAIQYTSGVPHTAGTPVSAPSSKGSWLRYDKTNKVLYRWTGAAWDAVSGAGAGGIFEGSGTVPSGAVATVTDQFQFVHSDDILLELTDYRTTLNGLDGNGNVAYSFYMDGTAPEAVFVDQSGIPRGIVYNDDYSANYTDRTLVDKGYVDAAVSSSGGLGYSVYTALISQTGTSDPTVTVLQNTLSGTPVWTRSSTGVYVATLTGAFPANKTTPFNSGLVYESSGFGTGYDGQMGGRRTSDDTWTLIVTDYVNGDPFDGSLSDHFIEIRVYP